MIDYQEMFPSVADRIPTVVVIKLPERRRNGERRFGVRLEVDDPRGACRDGSNSESHIISFHIYCIRGFGSVAY